MELFAGVRTFGMGAIALRLLGALLCGAMIGLDREMRSKRAGLKTHVLVCLGASLCVIVSECIILGREGVTTDATRVAANVVTGVGFLCAASLMTKGNGSIHGLTTAAGLWTTAVIGLACGAGWVEECPIFLYRGAWMEWELDRVDMAVPLSPDEVVEKRHAIFHHLSQKDNVPFPGEDTREFWQRAEERTHNTAVLYDKLGMAEYQAIEVFVRL